MNLACAAPLQPNVMKIDLQHVQTWNRFADQLYTYHQYLMSRHDVYTRERLGGYAEQPNFYREVSYYEKITNRLLSRIQWETSNPAKIHVIEVYVYDQHGSLKQDYLAAFLPGFRNAPVQTLINLHYANDELKSFRQFDASGARIYEQCQGTFFGEPLMLSLDEDDFHSLDHNILRTLNSEEYLACFEHTPHRVEPYLTPLRSTDIPTQLSQVPKADNQYKLDSTSESALMAKLDRLNKQIHAGTNRAQLLLERGQIYFELHEFDRAVDDYTAALALDDKLDNAYFGRGMARGRMGLIRQGIADLSIYIQRNPADSRAFTKRGVRYIWLGDLNTAKQDLQQAIKLDAENAEAHDDLGVIYANHGDYISAIKHFQKVVAIDPSYQKGFHNLALSYHISGKSQQALHNINISLDLSPQDKNSLLLKAEILNKLGMQQEAAAVREGAEFLPEGNWSERFSLH